MAVDAPKSESVCRGTVVQGQANSTAAAVARVREENPRLCHGSHISTPTTSHSIFALPSIILQLVKPYLSTCNRLVGGRSTLVATLKPRPPDRCPAIDARIIAIWPMRTQGKGPIVVRAGQVVARALRHVNVDRRSLLRLVCHLTLASPEMYQLRSLTSPPGFVAVDTRDSSWVQESHTQPKTLGYLHRTLRLLACNATALHDPEIVKVAKPCTCRFRLIPPGLFSAARRPVNCQTLHRTAGCVSSSI